MTTAPSQSPHAFWHFFAVFLHFFVFDGHAAVAHRPFPTFLAHFFAFHLSTQAASVRFTDTAATRATSSALRISPEAEPATEWRRQSKPAAKTTAGSIIVVVFLCIKRTLLSSLFRLHPSSVPPSSLTSSSICCALGQDTLGIVLGKSDSRADQESGTLAGSKRHSRRRDNSELLANCAIIPYVL